MATYYTSIYSGEEIDAAISTVNELTEGQTVAELLATIADLTMRVSALEGGG